MATVSVASGPVSQEKSSTQIILDKAKGNYDKAKRLVGEAIALDEKGAHRQALEEYGKGLKLLSEGLKLLDKCRHNSNVSSSEDKLIKMKSQVKERIQSLLEIVSSETKEVAGTTTNQGVKSAGTSTMAGTSTITGSRTVAGTLTTAGSRTVAGTSTMTGTRTVAGTSTTAGSCTVAGTSTTAGSRTVAGTSTTAGSRTVAGTSTTAGSRTVAGTSTMTGSRTVAGTSTTSSSPIAKERKVVKPSVTGGSTAEVVFSVSQGVGFFRVNKKGHVTQFDDVDSFHLFKLTREENGKPSAFIQCGQWVYPLVSGKSPVLKSSSKTYMFPELASDGSSSVGIVLDGASDDDVKELDEFLENNGHFKVSKHQRTHSETEERTWGSTVAKGITTGVSYVNKGLNVGSEYAGKLINYSSNKARSHLKACEEDVVLPEEVTTGASTAKELAGGLVHVSDVLMGSLASLTIKVGKKAFDIVSTSEVAQEMEVNPHIKEAWKVTKSGAIGAGNVFVTLEENGRALLGQLSDETSKTVEHKFGGQVGDVTSNGLRTAGHVTDLALTYSTWKTLGITFLGKLGHATAKEEVDHDGSDADKN